MEIRNNLTSTVIVHHVPVSSINSYVEWQQGITQAAESFFGYQGTEIYPPTEKGQLNWVAVMHFDSSNALQQWLDSPERCAWIKKLPPEAAEFRKKVFLNGFAPWFTDLVYETALWKVALTVLLGLYPTVMLLNIFVNPYLASLGFSSSMFIGNLLSVSILQWIVMPPLNKLLTPWLKLHKHQNNGLSLAGGVGIFFLLLAMMTLFRLVTG